MLQTTAATKCLYQNPFVLSPSKDRSEHAFPVLLQGLWRAGMRPLSGRTLRRTSVANDGTTGAVNPVRRRVGTTHLRRLDQLGDQNWRQRLRNTVERWQERQDVNPRPSVFELGGTPSC
jgi:hypothetical protein